MNRTTTANNRLTTAGFRRWEPARAARALAIACLAGAAATPAFAQLPTVSSPLSTSPEIPWYYSAQGPHSGGVYPNTDTTVNEIIGGVSTPVTIHAATNVNQNQFGTAPNNVLPPVPWAEGWGTDTNIWPPYDPTLTQPQNAPDIESTIIASYILGNFRGFNDYTNSGYNGSGANNYPTVPNLLGDEIDTPTDGPADAAPNGELVNFAPDEKGAALYNDFRDGGNLSWSGPLAWTYNDSMGIGISGQAGTETLDDTGAVAVAPASINIAAPEGSFTGGTTNATNPTWTGPYAISSVTNFGTFVAAGNTNTWVVEPDSTQTAINEEYERIGVTEANTASASASWSFVARVPGAYSLFVNIPDIPASGETRVDDAFYTVTITPAAGSPVITPAVTQVANVSQIEANAQEYVGGPYLVAAGETITLTLDNRTQDQGLPSPNSANPPVVVADTATLTLNSGAQIQGGSAVINKSDYPEVGLASYYGILQGTPNSNTSFPGIAYADPVPYGFYTTDVTGTPAVKGVSSAIPPQHEIRQLTYYGDAELVESIAFNGNGVPFPYQHYVGCVYCVDGLRGNVVWRYQCPDFFAQNSQFAANNGVFMTPVVTRINVMDPNPADVDANGNRQILHNKLVVIFGDQDGRVFCLDAIGNGILPANKISDQITGTGVATSVLDGKTTLPNEVYGININGAPTNVFTAPDIAHVTNYSLPLDFDGTLPATPLVLPINPLMATAPYETSLTPPTAAPPVATEVPNLDQWITNNGIETGAQISPTNTTGSPYFTAGVSADNLNTEKDTAGNFQALPASWRPLAVPYPFGNTNGTCVSLVAGTTTYWVFRPDGITGGTYISDDQTPPSTTNGIAFAPGASVNGTDNDGTPLNWTSTTQPVSAIAGNYTYVAAVNNTIAPANLATFTWSMELSAATVGPNQAAPQAGIYNVNVTIPPNADDPLLPGYTTTKRSTTAQYTVKVNGVALPTSPFTVSQNNPGSTYETLTLCQLNIGLNTQISVSVSNSSASPINNPNDANSFQTGETIVADSASLSFSEIAGTDTTTQMPLPGAFNNASPAIYVVPGTLTVNTHQSSNGPTSPTNGPSGTGAANPIVSPQPPVPPDAPPTGVGAATSVGDAYLYVVNSNGTMYSLDPTGTLVTEANIYQSYDIDSTSQTPSTIESPNWTPTVNVRWWFDTRRDNWANSFAHIDSAPSILVPDPVGNPEVHRVFFGDASETTNLNESDGRVYAIDYTGPINSVSGAPIDAISPTTPDAPPPYIGTITNPIPLGYNLNERPNWSFPDAYGQPDGVGNGSPNYTVENAGVVGQPAPALGDITGTPVPFYNKDTQETRIYFAADSGFEFGLEQATGGPSGGVTLLRQDPGTTGRIWSVSNYDFDGNTDFNTHQQSCWSFPSMWDPNNLAHLSPSSSNVLTDGNGNVYFPQQAIGAFTDMTPAVGYVQFPNFVSFFTNPTTQALWNHGDVINQWNPAAPVDGTGVCPGSGPPVAVPMLYAGCNGQNDIGFYALDLDGGDTTTTGAAGVDSSAPSPLNLLDQSRFIYRLESPNGFVWASPPVLIANQQASPDHFYSGAGNNPYTAFTGNEPIKGEAYPTQWGSGGAVFAAGGNTLYQIQATPVTNQNANETGPLINVDKQFVGFGALCPPTVAACNISGLDNTLASAKVTGATSEFPTDLNSPFQADPNGISDPDAVYADPNQVTEWVYSGDQADGLFRGMTPANQAFGAGAELGEEMPVNPNPVNPINAQLPLHAYIGAVPVNSMDMTPGAALNGGPGGMLAMATTPTPSATTFFDWGQSIYVRITNVVPPNPGDANHALEMSDPSGQLGTGFYLTNGSPVSYTITEVPASTVTAGATFTDYQASGSVATLTTLPGDGFALRTLVAGSGGYPGSDDYIGPPTNQDTALGTQTLVDQNNDEWLYASTYFIGNGTGHADTPGASRRIINATQTCQVYAGTAGAGGTPTNNTVTLTTEVGQGSAYATTAGGLNTGIAQVIPSPDPTFGIANPIAIIGGGISHNDNWLSNTPQYLLRYLGGLGYERNYTTDAGTANTPTLNANQYTTPNANLTNQGLDMQAQGNFVYQKAGDLPPAGLAITGDPTQLNSANNNVTNNFTPVGTQVPVETNVGFIHDGQGGDNVDTSISGDPAADPLTTPAAFGGVTLGLGDRSAVGLRGMSIKLEIGDVASQWFDWTGDGGSGTVINYLPWEVRPYSYDYGSNPSNDYPDVATGNLQAVLNTVNKTLGAGPRQGRGGNMVNNGITPDPRDVNPADNNQITYNDSVTATLTIPKYQPANLSYEEVYLPSTGADTGSQVPVGYQAVEKVFVNTNNSNPPVWVQGEAYRDFTIKAGVPINVATHMGQQTVDVGTVPGGFGVQMDPYLTALDPNIVTGNATTNNKTATDLPWLFTPYTAYYQRYFQPLAVYNDGNVNLLNIHLDQKNQANATPPIQSLQSNTVDNNASIPDIDFLNETYPDSGLNANDLLPNSAVGNEAFLLRSSLDTDLAQAYGIDPAMYTVTDGTGQPYIKTYQGLTFHKALPGSASPTQLTVPDLPPAASNPQSQWYYPVITGTGTSGPTLGPNGFTSGNMDSPAQPTVPYVSVAVPLGTPAGSYEQTLAIFDNAGTPFNSFSPPFYGGIQIGLPQSTTGAAVYPGAYGTTDTPLASYNTQTTASNYGATVYSNPPSTLKVTVAEHRLTDAGPDYLNPATATTNPNLPNGTVEGARKEIADPAAVTAQTLPDVYPAAIRDISWAGGAANGGETASGTGNLGLIWSSARASTSTGSYPALDLAGAFIANGTSNNNTSTGAFLAVQPAAASPASSYVWWNTVSDLLTATGSIPPGSNTGTSIAQDVAVYSPPPTDAFTSGGSDYAFWVNTDTEEPGNPVQTNTGLTSVWCAQYNPTTGELGTAVPVSPLPSTRVAAGATATPVTAALQGAYQVRGLNLTTVSTLGSGSATDMYMQNPNSTTQTQITNNLWAFWSVGGHGSSTVYYESGVGGATPAFTQLPLALPIPAGLSSVSDPSPTVLPAPDTTAPPTSGTGWAATYPTVPLIEITYSGVNQLNQSDIYVSRYRPYLSSTPSATSGMQNVALWPVPYPFTTELLKPDAAGIWWNARDIGWVRNSNIEVVVDGVALVAPGLTGANGQAEASSYDKSSGMLVFTNLPSGLPVNAVYVDLPHGRVRFSPSGAVPITVGTGATQTSVVSVTVNAMARRITAAPTARPSSEPASFIDTAFANNEAFTSGVDNGAPRVQSARYWFIYRKGGSGPADTVGATLWMNTQRLGISLYNSAAALGTAAAGAPLTISPGQVSSVTVTDQTTTQALFPPATAGSGVDIDWAHGYVYFPLLVAASGVVNGGWTSPEGHLIKVVFTAANGNQYTDFDYVHWIDEPRYNDSTNGGGNGSAVTVALPNGGTPYQTAYASAIAPTTANEEAVPMNVSTNESTPCAFLDPIAYADLYGGPVDPFGLFGAANQTVVDQPHRVWVFWSSTRNAGTPAGSQTGNSNAASDLYYEALAPAFGAAQ